MKTGTLVIFELEFRDAGGETKNSKIHIFNDRLNPWINIRYFWGNAGTFLSITLAMTLIPAKSVWNSPQALLWAESKTSLLSIFEEPGHEKIICHFPHYYVWKGLFCVSYGIFHTLPSKAVLRPIVLTHPESSAEIILVGKNNTCISRGSFIVTK